MAWLEQHSDKHVFEAVNLSTDSYARSLYLDIEDNVHTFTVVVRGLRRPAKISKGDVTGARAWFWRFFYTEMWPNGGITPIEDGHPFIGEDWPQKPADENWESEAIAPE